MYRKRRHLSERQLLLTADRELSPRQMAHTRGHLAECAWCGARLRNIQRTLADATQLSRPEPATPPSSAFASRARLAMRLTELSRRPPRPAAFWAGSWGVACGALAVAGTGVLLLVAASTTVFSTRALDVRPAAFLRPRADLTPGATRPVSTGEVCGAGRYGRTEPVPTAVRQAVFARYGADVQRLEDYELDYLITPELGGTPAAANLWPQPYSQTEWNAYVKDELEIHLHRLVCDGAIEIATAQRDIATDWIAAYKRYFRTERPRRDYAAAPLTERDGELLRSELDELGMARPDGPADGPTLMAMLRAARGPSASGPAHSGTLVALRLLPEP